MQLQVPNIRTDRLYSVTVNWATQNQKRYKRDFLICAGDKNDAETIAKNHIPKQFITTNQPDDISDIKIRVRDLGLSQKNRTYYVSPITETHQINIDEPSLLEHTAAHFAYMFGYEISTLSHTEPLSDAQKQRLSIMNQIENKTQFYLQLAADFLYQKDIDRNVFFQQKIDELTKTQNIDNYKSANTGYSNNTNPDQFNALLEQAKQQADMIINNAKETAKTIIDNAKLTADTLIKNTQATLSTNTALTKEKTNVVNNTNDMTSENEPKQQNIEMPIDTKTETINEEPVTEEPVAEETVAEETVAENATTETSDDSQNNSIDTILSPRVTKNIEWIDRLDISENPKQLSRDEIISYIDNLSNEQFLQLLENKTFNFETNITPTNYFHSEIINGELNDELTDIARQATKIAILCGINYDDNLNLFQSIVYNYLQNDLKEQTTMYTVNNNTNTTENVMPHTMPDETTQDDETTQEPSWMNEDDAYDEEDTDTEEQGPYYEDDPDSE